MVFRCKYFLPPDKCFLKDYACCKLCDIRMSMFRVCIILSLGTRTVFTFCNKKFTCVTTFFMNFVFLLGNCIFLVLIMFNYCFSRKISETMYWMVEILVSQVPGFLSHYHHAFFSMNFMWTTRLCLSGCWILSSTNLDDIRLSWQFASVFDAPSRNTWGHQLKSACLEKHFAIRCVRNYCAYKQTLSHCRLLPIIFLRPLEAYRNVIWTLYKIIPSQECKYSFQII